MANVIQIKRGVEANIPTLADGEGGWCTDTLRLYIGQGGVNKLVGEADFLKKSGGTLTGSLTLNADPTANLHAATKQYVDNLIQGINAKGAVRAATTANITLSGTQTIDGVVLSVDDRVLVKNQTTTSQNGIYLAKADTWERAADANSWDELVSLFAWVEEGTANGDKGWLCTVDAGGTLGTTAATFVQFSGTGQITAGNGLSKSGDTLAVNLDGSTLSVGSSGLKVASSGITATQLATSVAGTGLSGGAGTALSVTYGTAAGTACQGNDSRLSDARTPVTHAVNASTYGYGTTTNAGHLRVGTGLTVSSGTVSHTAHTGDVTGSTALTIANKQTLTASGGVNISNSPTVIASAAPVITLTYGTTASTVCQGNDSRLSDARTPLSHTHGNITNAGAIGSTSGLPIITTTSGVLSAGSFGTAAGSFCQGNDSRLSDARTPLSHTHGNITNAGAIGTTSGLPIITTTSGVLTAGSFGTAAGSFCQGNDSRLHNQNTDTGTSSETFQVGSVGPVLKKNSTTRLALYQYNGTDLGDLYLRNIDLSPDSAEEPVMDISYAGSIRWFNSTNQFASTFKLGALTVARTWTLPDETGTLLTDISTVDGGTW